jgi:hypothetical protein
MRGIISKLLISSSLFSVSFLAQAGSTCLAETHSGKLVKVNLFTAGTFSRFLKAEITITNSKGEIILSDIIEHSAQFAELMRDEKAVVVYANMGKDFDVQLSYLGKDFSEVEWQNNLSLEQILRDPKRVKEEGNSLKIDGVVEGSMHFNFRDIVCSLDHDV